MLASSLLGCASTPEDIDDACEILGENRSWYRSAKRSFERWGVPIHVQLAIIHQESRFKDDAKPPRRKLLGVLPWKRQTSAYGYAQVKDSTWDWYIQKTGNRGADRDDFDDAVDFIGWYGNRSYKMLRISKWDAYRQYLAYHEGHGGFKRGTYRSKAWLTEVAKKVQANAKRYAVQLRRCQDDLEKGRRIWPF